MALFIIVKSSLSSILFMSGRLPLQGERQAFENEEVKSSGRVTSDDRDQGWPLTLVRTRKASSRTSPSLYWLCPWKGERQMSHTQLLFTVRLWGDRETKIWTERSGQGGLQTGGGDWRKRQLLERCGWGQVAFPLMSATHL